MKLTTDEVRHVAKLANLDLDEDEVVRVTKQLGETISYIAQLDEVGTEGVEPTSQVTGLMNVMRNDENVTSLTQEQALQNTQSTINGYFKVPAVLEDV